MAFYNWRHEPYKEYVIHILSNLIPIFYQPEDMIIDELEVIGAVTFIANGITEFGFTLNKETRWVLQKKRVVLGAFEVIFDKRSLFVIRAKTYSTGYFIKRQPFKELK
jgi:hypothetical protein